MHGACHSPKTLPTMIRANERGGGSAGTSVRSPESQEGACESLKDTIALAIHVLFYFCPTFCWYVQLFLAYLEK